MKARSEGHRDFTLTAPGVPVEEMRYLAEFGTHSQQTVSTGATSM